jgi:hypothetical protein
MAHLKTDTYPFYVALRETRAMLPEVVQSHVLSFINLVVQSHLQMQSSMMDQLHE